MVCIQTFSPTHQGSFQGPNKVCSYCKQINQTVNYSGALFIICVSKIYEKVPVCHGLATPVLNKGPQYKLATQPYVTILSISPTSLTTIWKVATTSFFHYASLNFLSCSIVLLFKSRERAVEVTDIPTNLPPTVIFMNGLALKSLPLTHMLNTFDCLDTQQANCSYKHML